ncbi:MAG: hypothetical protein KF861_24895, partial [Planctomycetaceae bacterium]|nr:hypothetical protein [Planctomycetaceae bacterium]
MPSRNSRVVHLSCLILVAAAAAGCNAVPMYQYRQSQMQSFSLYQQNQSMAGQMAAERQQFEQMAAQMQGE